jgi:hypothetical protein
MRIQFEERRSEVQQWSGNERLGHRTIHRHMSELCIGTEHENIRRLASYMQSPMGDSFGREHGSPVSIEFLSSFFTEGLMTHLQRRAAQE